MSDINVTVQDEIVNIDVLDTPVLVNVVNSPGQQGPAGPGVPVGGTTGQVLAKNSSTNYDTVWVNQSGGVPYTGATGNVNLGEYELKAGQVTLDTSPTGTASVGTIRWNDTTGTSETTLKGGNVIIKNGVDLVARVVNKVTPNTTLTKAAYQAVRVSGAQGQRLAVALAQANNDANSADTIGIVIETIPTNQEGFIMTVGQLEGINTTGSLQGETWADGDVLYLSPTTAGAITNIKPTAVTGHIVVIGYVEYAHQNNGKIYVKVMNGWELDELHNVSIVTPTNNQGLFYNSSNSLWENKSVATVIGYTPEQPLTFNSPLSRAGNVVSIPQATGSVNGFLSATDWTTFNSKQAALGYTPANAATTLTINGVTFDLSANRSWTIAAGISGSGAAGQVTYWTGSSAVSGSNNLFWDATNSILGIGSNSINTGWKLGVNGNVQINGFLSFGTLSSSTSNAYIEVLANIVNIYAHTSRGIAFFANAAERARITTTGNLMLGTTSDLGVRLGVVGDTLLRGSGNTSATTALTVQNSASSNLFVVRNDGNVGIGTNSPLNILTVAGVIEIRNSGGVGSAQVNTLKIGTYVDGNYGSSISVSTNYSSTVNTDLRFETTGAERMRLDASGNLLVGGTSVYGATITSYATSIRSGGIGIRNSAGTAAGFFGTYAAGSGSGSTDILAESAGFISISTGGSEKHKLFANGNVSIGTTSDLGVRLGVVGDTILRGSGATSATTALTVQNSSSTNLFRVRNDGNAFIDTTASFGGLTIVNTNAVGNSASRLTVQANTSAVSFFNHYNSNAGLGLANNGGFGSDNSIVIFSDATLPNGGTNSIQFRTGGYETTQERLRIKPNGQVRFVPLASAPASPQAGDVYYDSTLNKLRVYTTAWETITSI